MINHNTPEIIYQDIWLKKSKKDQKLPEGAEPIIAYESLIGGAWEKDEILYLIRTQKEDQLWTVAGEMIPEPDRETLLRGETSLWNQSLEFNFSIGCVLSIPAQYSKVQSSLLLLDELCRSKTGYESPTRFIAAGILSRTDFDSIVQSIKYEIHQNRLRAVENETEMIRTARELGLDPEPPLLSASIWSARCPGTSHKIFISSVLNTFGCGYCGWKGGPKELDEFTAYRRALSTTT
jgi:hypothetical protein